MIRVIELRTIRDRSTLEMAMVATGKSKRCIAHEPKSTTGKTKIERNMLSDPDVRQTDLQMKNEIILQDTNKLTREIGYRRSGP